MKTVKFKDYTDRDVFIPVNKITGFCAAGAGHVCNTYISTGPETEDEENGWYVSDTPEEVEAILDAVPDAPAIDAAALMDMFWNTPFPEALSTTHRLDQIRRWNDDSGEWEWVAKPVKEKPCKYKFTKGEDKHESYMKFARTGITVTMEDGSDKHINAIEIYQAQWLGVTSLERSQALRDFVLAKLNEENEDE